VRRRGEEEEQVRKEEGERGEDRGEDTGKERGQEKQSQVFCMCWSVSVISPICDLERFPQDNHNLRQLNTERERWRDGEGDREREREREWASR